MHSGRMSTSAANRRGRQPRRAGLLMVTLTAVAALSATGLTGPAKREMPVRIVRRVSAWWAT